ncbi:MAG: flippase-like domain-containing protein [Rhodospirillaceae bacterium]|nr:flippase-like domain-containing protein [Rhodospirillaceae bacterium]
MPAEAGSRPTAGRLRAAASLAVKIGLSAALLAWVLSGVDRDALASRLSEAAVGPLVGLVAAMLGLAVLQAWRWRLVLRALEGHGRPLPAVRIVFLSLFFLQAVPSTLGADAVRAWAAFRRGVRLTDAVASVVVDRAVALAALIAIVLAGLPWLFRLTGGGVAAWSALMICAAGIGGIVLVAGLGWLPLRWQRWKPLHALKSVGLALRCLLRAPRILGTALALSVVIHLGSILILAAIGWIFATPATLGQFLVIGPAVLIVTMAPVSIAGWGVREGAMVIGLGYAGVAEDAALATSLVFGAVLAAAGLVGGAVWLATDLAGRRLRAR